MSMSAEVFEDLPRSPNLSARTTFVVGNEQQFQWLRTLVFLIILLNFGDALFTLHWIQTGQATEANPVLWELAHYHPMWFVIAKSLLVGLGSWLLLRYRERPAAVVSLFTAFMAYYWVFLYHLKHADLQLFAQLTP